MISKKIDRLVSDHDHKLQKSGSMEVRRDMKTIARTLTAERRILYDMTILSVTFNMRGKCFKAIDTFVTLTTSTHHYPLDLRN